MKNFRFVILLPMMAIFLAGCGGSGNETIFGTGNSAGTYYAYGSKLVEMIQADNKNYSFNVKTTAGSAANLRLLHEGFLDMAIVQSDTLSDAVKGAGIFVSAGAAQGYAAVAGLYTEACQIVVAKDSPIQSIYDLAGRKVSVGEKESGVLQNAEEILMAHGLTVEMLDAEYLSFSDSAAALESGEIEAFFCTAGAPTKAVADLAARKEIRLLSITPDVARNIMRMFSGYTACAIPAGTYVAQDEDVSTLGVKAVLVANVDVADDEIFYVTEFLINNADKLKGAVNVPTDLNLDYAVQDIPSAFHAGAAKFYQSKGVDVNVYSGGSSKSLKAGQD